VPASDCFGSCWQIGGCNKLQWRDHDASAIEEQGSGAMYVVQGCGLDVGEPGDQYKVRLETLGKYRVVTWTKVVDDKNGPEIPIKAFVRPAKYSVIGSFTGWMHEEMSREESETGTLHVCNVKLTRVGDEFQIAVNENSHRAIHPESSGSGPGLALGPDELGLGRTWKLHGVPGDTFKIFLERLVQSDVMVTTVRWEKTGHEMIPEVPLNFYVVGDWDHWARPLIMTPSNGGYVLQRTMPRQGSESFTILYEGSYSAQIHPSLPRANPYSRHVVGGPSSNAWGKGLHWTVGAHASDERLRGETYEIILELSGGGGVPLHAKTVTWRGR